VFARYTLKIRITMSIDLHLTQHSGQPFGITATASAHWAVTETRVPARHQHDAVTRSQEADFTCCRPRRRGISCCCGWHSWAAGLLLLLLVDVDVVVLVVAVDFFSEKPGTVYSQAMAYGSQKLQFVVSSDIISCGIARYSVLPSIANSWRLRSTWLQHSL